MFSKCVGSNKVVVGSIDQGTQSSKFIYYDDKVQKVYQAQHPHKQYYPKSGWIEHDAMEIWASVVMCINDVHNNGPQDVKCAAFGITNQRETIVAWDRKTGKPLHKAIVWCDLRTQSLVKELEEKHNGVYAFRDIVGLPINTYFSAVKVLWLLKNVPAVKEAHDKGNCQFGTMDCWVIYKLTGGPNKGVHVTDVTNASRTLLMDVNTCQWSDKMLSVFGIKKEALPQIKSSCEVYGTVTSPELPSKLQGTPIAGCIGDQQSACVGQGLFETGGTKVTLGTGAFLLQNTGTKPIVSNAGLLTTPCYQMGPKEPVVWALEGSIAIAGAGISWLKNNMGLFAKDAETEDVLRNTPDTGDVYFVPAFSGLYAPRWRDDARGCIVGLTLASEKKHVIRAMCEGICFQINEVLESMDKDLGQPHSKSQDIMKVDGGMTFNEPFVQLLSDITKKTIMRPANVEVTSLGAAIAAGLAVHVWPDVKAVQAVLLGPKGRNFAPIMKEGVRKQKLDRWNEAIERSLSWVTK
eukprot:Platyproteum_vivax@DN8237_c0_g1_i1.p1